MLTDSRVCALGFVLFALTTLAGPSDARNTVTYYHNDILGSAVAATDDAGHVIWREHYAPYGQRAIDSPFAKGDRNGYTGNIEDESSGLLYLRARYYDPAIGRFISVDPVGFAERKPHSFNRYAYANNNPYRFVDHKGESPEAILDLSYNLGGLVVTGGLNLYGRFTNDTALVAVTADAFGDTLTGVGLAAVGVLSPIPGTSAALKVGRVAKGASSASKRLADRVQVLPAVQRPNTVAVIRHQDGTITVGRNQGGVTNSRVKRNGTYLGASARAETL